MYYSSSGRALLDWYWKLESYSGSVLFRPLILPAFWVDEARRIRHELMGKDYLRFPPEARFPRLLDDMWQDTWSTIPAYNASHLVTQSLKRLHGKQLADAVASLEENISVVWTTLDRIKKSPESAQLFEAMEVGAASYSLRHSSCCPPLPFHSVLQYAYPPAAGLDLVIAAIRQFIRCHLYVPAQQFGCHIELLEQEFRRVRIDQTAYEMCRIFAAVEETFGHFPGALMPHFIPFIMAGFFCNVEVRPWFWHKLVHFEELGSTFIEPHKRQLAVFWGTPELAKRSFKSLKIQPLEKQDWPDSEAVNEAGRVASEEAPERPQAVDQENLDLDESP